MKYIRLFFIAFVAALSLVACGSDDDSAISDENTYRQTVTLDMEGTRQTVTLNDLNSKIDNVNNSNQWLTVLIGSYTSGAPSIVVSATPIPDTQQRSGIVTITAGNKRVILTVIQSIGIDDPHDVPTDQPAYSR